eukprot:c33796_g1_i1 orf=1-171(+)
MKLREWLQTIPPTRVQKGKRIDSTGENSFEEATELEVENVIEDPRKSFDTTHHGEL